MTLNIRELRLEGVYEQRQPGTFMLRVKVPGAVLSAEQALKVCEIAERFAGGGIHLTSRASIEFHWLKGENLAEVMRMLAAVGLTTRGACGGAVRGIVCSTPFAAEFPTVQVLARKLHHHFTLNPHFEDLPKKFKIGVDAGYDGSRHLIQDAGLVYAGNDGEGALYDVWVAGGLGREPRPAFLLEERIPEARIIPLLEGIIRIYRRHTPAGKRLKHLLREIGREEFIRRLGEEVDRDAALPLSDGCDKCLTPVVETGRPQRLEVRVFAGELEAGRLRDLCGIAAQFAGGFMVLTCDQNVAFLLDERADIGKAEAALVEKGVSGAEPGALVNFRVCPGSHECRMGLGPTRDISRAIIEALGPQGESLTWAISGCPNSCSQPQLAQVGIIIVKIVAEPGGERTPRFDLYRREGEEAFAAAVHQGITLDELLQAVAKIG